MQRLQVESSLSNKVQIDQDGIQDFLDSITYPISYFDFETFTNAIPRFEGQSPYQQILFQYSLHIQKKSGDIKHKEFLGDEFSDPRRKLAERMLKDIPKKGTILAYNMSLKKLKSKGSRQSSKIFERIWWH
ncbi:MAG: DUF2779 domain-containing protein [SAR324 cluster bacterium]|nr:DUF2779 domain-containing protein [SAR324 cluster bacterium]